MPWALLVSLHLILISSSFTVACVTWVWANGGLLKLALPLCVKHACITRTFLLSYKYSCISVCVGLSPLDGLLCLVCMVSVPTTAPMFCCCRRGNKRVEVVCRGLYLLASRVWTATPHIDTHPLVRSRSPLSGCSQFKPPFSHPFIHAPNSHTAPPSPSPHSPSHFHVFFFLHLGLLPYVFPPTFAARA